MIGTYAKRLWAPDYPCGPTRAEHERFFETISSDWGGPVGIEVRAPSRANDPAFRDWWSTYLRMGASPGAALALTRMNAEIDVRHVLPPIRVPTLVLHRTDDHCLKVEEGRYVAAADSRRQFVELPGDDHLPFVGDQDAMLDEIEAFLNRLPHDAVADRVLATMLSVRLGGRPAARPPARPSWRTPAARSSGSAVAGRATPRTACAPPSTDRPAPSAAPRRWRRRRRATGSRRAADCTPASAATTASACRARR